MKYANTASFEKHLVSAAPNHLADVYLIVSQDSFERKSGSKSCLDSFLKEGSDAFGVKVLQGEAVTADELSSELYSFSLLASEQIVVLHDVDKSKNPVKLAVVDYCEKESCSTTLILTASSLASNTKLYKRAEKAGVVLDLSKGMKPWEKEKELEKWLYDQVEAEGKKLAPLACRFLLQHVGREQGTLYQEIQKLVTYIGERPSIEVNDVSTVSIQVPLESIWKLGESVFARKGGDALRVAKGLMETGVQPLGLLSQLRRQVQTDFQVCSLLNSGGGPQAITNAFPYMRGKILNQHISAARSYGMERFKRALLTIDETERRMKNSAIDAQFLVEKLLVEVTR